MNKTMKTNAINNVVTGYVRPGMEVLPIAQLSIICDSPSSDNIEGSGHDFSFDD